MLQKIKTIKFLIAFSAVIFLLNLSVQAQSNWLGMETLPSWNERSRAILQIDKISNDELKRCSIVVRQPTLPQDRLLTKMGWTLVGEAQIFGDMTAVTVAQAFDGMCRPMKFQTLIFVGNRVAGTLSPGAMDSRSDGYLTNVKLTTEKTLTAYYARYRQSDALCCPYKTEAVTFTIKPDGKNFLLVPEMKIDADAKGGNQNSDDAGKLENTSWRWQSTETASRTTKVDKPENYQLEFTADGKIRVLADCNRGGGSYESSGESLKFSPIFTTKMACPSGSLDMRFLNDLQAAQSYKIDGKMLLINLSGGGAMKFSGASSSDSATVLENTLWRWQSINDRKDEIIVDKPENYQIQFNPNGELGVKADCNGGGGTYKIKDDKLLISSIIRTQVFCGEQSLDGRFVKGLESARTFRVSGNFLFIESETGTLKFFRVHKQN